MKKSQYFNHDYNARKDPKIIRMVRMLGWESYGLFWALIEISGEEGNHGKLKFENVEDIAWDLRVECDLLMRIIAEFDLFDRDKRGIYFWSKRFQKHLEKRQEISETRAKIGREGGLAKGKQLLNQEPSKTEAKSSKVNKKKVNKKEKESKVNCDSQFEIFWENYPNKKSKKKAREIWEKIPEAEHPAIMAGLENYKRCDQWLKDGGRYIPHPTTFLNQRRWEDKIEVDFDGEAAAREEQIKTRADQYQKSTGRYATEEQRNLWREKLKRGEPIF